MTLPVNQILCGDNMEVMKGFPDNCFDTIVTDPPYGLGFMGKEWDKLVEPNRDSAGGFLRDGKSGSNPYAAARCRHGSDMLAMQQWHYNWAAEALRVAKPGAIMLIFGGTRTFHRLTCAIEDAGWQIRDCMMWLYGSGFPKSHDISKAIDKAKGAERKKGVTKKQDIFGKYDEPSVGKYHNPNTRQNWCSSGVKTDLITINATDLAKLWDGWGTALKPAWEPIIVAMKPLDGTFAQNAEKWGVAGLNIDGGRIDYQSDYDKSQATPQGKCTANIAKGARPDIDNEERSEFERPEQKGRWPANVILDETIEGEWTRYFYCPKASRSERNAGLEGMREKENETYGEFQGTPEHAPKLNAKKQNSHPTVKPLKLMEYLCILTKTPTGGIVLDPFGGSGTTAMACVNTGREYVLIEKDPDYCEIARRRVAYAKKQRQGQMALFE